ncbi:hypothetical protein C1646_749053 [Rhizophagus diaphanus]|nr:hypothetical protein C1646_749053 [Rhizophagus diaphanus] [Rhizophagus sp. MUCL 43196]
MKKNIQDAELEALLEYDNAEEFSNTDNLNGMSDNEYEIEDIAEKEKKEKKKKKEEEDTMKLYVGKIIHNWDCVANFMKKYTATKGHEIRISGRKRVDKITQEIKNEHTCVTMLEKLSPNYQKDKFHLAKLNLHPSAIKFGPILQKLSDEIMKEIRFLTVIAKTNAIIQYQIIREKFKIRIHRPDLYNAISKFYRESTPETTGISLRVFVTDSDPAVSDAVAILFPDTFHMHSRAFTSKYFTADVQTTSHNEGENSVLKWLFGNSNLSLCELFDALEERYQKEVDYCKFMNWHQTIPQIRPQNISTSIFGPVAQQLNEFVMPNIMKKQKEQIELSFYYHAVEIELEVLHSKEMPRIVVDDPVKRRPKGHPKLNKRMKNTLELSNTKT